MKTIKIELNDCLYNQCLNYNIDINTILTNALNNEIETKRKNRNHKHQMRII